MTMFFLEEGSFVMVWAESKSFFLMDRQAEPIAAGSTSGEHFPDRLLPNVREKHSQKGT